MPPTPTATDAPRRTLGPQHRVAIIGSIVVVFAASLLAMLGPTVSSFGERPLVFLGLVVAFALAERLIFHVEAKHEAVSYTPTELALAVGLVFLDPEVLVAARLLGATIGMIVWRRPSPFKMAVNLANFAFETALAATVFGALRHDGSSVILTWITLVASMVIALVCGGIVVAIVIAQFEGRLGERVSREVRNAHIFYLPSTVVAACVALPAAIDPQLGLIALIPAPLLWYLVRSHGNLIHRFTDLASVHDFNRDIAETSDIVELCRLAAEQIAIHTRADRVSLRIFQRDGSPVDAFTGEPIAAELLPPSPSDSRWGRVFAAGDPQRLTPTAAAPLDRLVGAGARGALTATIGDADGVVGFAVIADRRGATSNFDDDDISRIRAMIQQLAVAVRKSQLHSQIQFEATHDRLTSLPNRSYFESWISRVAADRRGATMLIDLDRFKQINDSFGHHAGDIVLVEAADRIRRICGPDDVAARFGGDEFAVFTLDADRSTELAEKIAAALEEPFDIASASVAIAASIGIALAPDHATEVSGLLRKADIAMYDAKTRHVRSSIFRDSLDENDSDRLMLLADLRKAIHDGALDVHYQPQIELATGHVHGVEALARWDHPHRGRISPDVFIALAEQAGIIEPLTNLIMTRSMEQVAQWNATGCDLHLSINISTQSLLDERLGPMVDHALLTTGLAPRQLVLEITESTVMSDPLQSHRVLRGLSDLGIKISVDDFGTGFSSLVNLRSLAVDEIKIDRSFVMAMTDQHDDEVIVRSTIDLGHNLGLRVVAEGVETPETLRRLRNLGCDLAQGYLISRPLPAAQLRDWLAHRDVPVDAPDLLARKE